MASGATRLDALMLGVIPRKNVNGVVLPSSPKNNIKIAADIPAQWLIITSPVTAQSAILSKRKAPYNKRFSKESHMAKATATKKPIRKVSKAALALMQLKRSVDTDAAAKRRKAIKEISGILPDLNVGQLISLVSTSKEMLSANQ